MTSSRVTLLAAVSGVVAAFAAGCGGGGGGARAVEPTAAAPLLAVQKTACVAGSLEPLGSARLAYAAVVRGRAHAFRQPGRRPFATFGRMNQNGVPTVLGVRGAVVDASCRATWYLAQLPQRPNGVTGYIRAGDVVVARVRTRIVVDLSARRLTFFRDGRARLSTPVAIGSAATPTPVGRFYVNQRLLAADERGPFGPGALGVSAFSPVLTHWTQGGPIAIHGTNAPWSIGHAVSNGCIRVANRTLHRLFAATLAGTPVVIRA
jgi:lipoprotein-anchoring transpeptidase ErfK/SrfK